MVRNFPCSASLNARFAGELAANCAQTRGFRGGRSLTLVRRRMNGAGGSQGRNLLLILYEIRSSQEWIAGSKWAAAAY